MPTNQQCVLVVGGAGYIGSHMAFMLKRAGFMPIILDNLHAGHLHAIPSYLFFQGDMQDIDLLAFIFKQYPISTVMHFASYINVAESILYPEKYYANNVNATFHLLDTMLRHGVYDFIFSSSAAVYGEPQYVPIDEAHPQHPITPYGRSKKIVESILKDCAKSDRLSYSILRYFNAAGCLPEEGLGEEHDPEFHLIPLLLKTIREKSCFKVYGNDYPTSDGTCIRDYVHVYDICQAHLLVLQAMLKGQKYLIYNIGNGNGFSVLDVINAARFVTGAMPQFIYEARRQGDPALLVADSQAIQENLNWQPQYPDISTIIQHMWQFMQRDLIAKEETNEI